MFTLDVVPFVINDSRDQTFKNIREIIGTVQNHGNDSKVVDQYEQNKCNKLASITKRIWICLDDKITSFNASKGH
jgi:hypothetical protein